LGIRLACFISMTGVACAPLAAQAPNALNVRDFGAVGDGQADDTPAFQTALDQCAAAGGGIVYAPTGRYRIATHLAIPKAVTLEGVFTAPPTVNAYHDPADPAGAPLLGGTVLLAEEGAGDENGPAFISMETNATLKGVTIFHPNQTKTNPPVAYPWTVKCIGADNCAVIDVLMVNPYQAVDFGSAPSGRHMIRNLYAQALRRGVYIDRCLDVGRVENVHIWPFWTAADADSPVATFMLEQGEAFILGRSDWELMTNCFAIAYNAGFRFAANPDQGPHGGAGNYMITGGGADMCRSAVLVEQTQGHSGVSFANCQIFGDVVVRETNTGPIRFTGCGFFGSVDGARGTALARLAGPGRVSFDNCSLYCIHPQSRNAPMMIHAESGRLSIQNCVFINSRNTEGVNSNPVPIVLEPEVRSAVIVGNEFYGEARIDNRARGRVVIEHNIRQTDEEPFPEKGE